MQFCISVKLIVALLEVVRRLLWFGCVCQYHVFSVVVLVTRGPKPRVSEFFHVSVSNVTILSIYVIKYFHNIDINIGLSITHE